MGSRRSQSAMEYLMTYGWAILIIAVILGVLFSLGVFNPVNYAPKVPAGNCHVFRPNGPGTNFNVALVGTCSGFLPQYVAQFNGKSSNIDLGTSINPTGPFTIVSWVNFVTINTIENTGIVGNGNWANYGLDFGYSSGSYLNLETEQSGSSTSVTANSGVPIGIWAQIAGEFDGNTLKIYQNGALVGSAAGSAPLLSSHHLYIGRSPQGGWLTANGSIANVQIYNTSLDANEIQYLYNEGIGGAPIYLSHLVGWWPLNGDAKDYSGNGYQGTSYNLSFNGSWATGYSQP